MAKHVLLEAESQMAARIAADEWPICNFGVSAPANRWQCSRSDHSRRLAATAAVVAVAAAAVVGLRLHITKSTTSVGNIAGGRNSTLPQRLSTVC